MIDATITELTPLVGVKAACAAVGRARATHYRHHRASPPPPPRSDRPTREPVRQPRALSEAEEAAVLDVLHSERFVDMAPGEVHAVLLDEGTYLCSVSTMYRLLRRRGEVRERRAQATHPARIKPELIAEGPNRVWSWDITKLHGPAKWTYYYLYSVIDIYSRYTVGWMVATREAAPLAERLLAETITKEGVVEPAQLTIHADNGSSMASKPVAFLLADLGVTKTHSRPHVSNDNPYSEAQFKTLKYRPDFPTRFGSIEVSIPWNRGDLVLSGPGSVGLEHGRARSWGSGLAVGHPEGLALTLARTWSCSGPAGTRWGVMPRPAGAAGVPRRADRHG